MKLINKAQFKQLEKLFSAEIDGRMFQTRGEPKWILALLEFDLVQRDRREYTDKFGTVVCNGWALTHAGRFSYCINCEGEPK